MSKKRMRNTGEEILKGLSGDHQMTEAEREILTRLAEGEQEIARGEGHDLDDVLAEADSLLLRP